MAAKRQRLDIDVKRLAHVGNCTISGAAQLLKRLSGKPALPEGITKRQLQWQLQKGCDDFKRIGCELKLPAVSGDEPVTWELCHPGRLMRFKLEMSLECQDMWSKALERCPMPWKVVVAFDEFSPGNKLKVDNQRKTMNMHVNFLELGQQALWTDASWMTVASVRQKLIKSVDGGFSAMLCEFLKLLFLGAEGLATAGVMVHVKGRGHLIFGTLHALLADGEGIAKAFDWRGSSSTKPCLRHWNVLSKGSGLVELTAGFVEIGCCRPELMKLTSQEDIDIAVNAIHIAKQRVSTREWTKERFTTLLKTLGLNTSDRSLLADASLRRLNPLGALRYDWVHSLLQDGCLSQEIFLMVVELERVGHSMQDLKAFFKDSAWCFPSQGQKKMQSLWQVFSESRNSQFKLRMTSSECLGVYAILRHFVETRLTKTEDTARWSMCQVGRTSDPASIG